MAKKSKKAKRATALEAAGELMSSRRVVMERVALVSAIGRMRQATVLSTADVWDDVWDDGHRSGLRVWRTTRKLLPLSGGSCNR